MTRWEYMKTADMSVEAMNVYGAEGWELIGERRQWLWWKRTSPAELKAPAPYAFATQLAWSRKP